MLKNNLYHEAGYIVFHTYQIIKEGRFEMAGYSEVTPWPVCAILDCHLKPCGIFITKFVNTGIISSFFQ